MIFNRLFSAYLTKKHFLTEEHAKAQCAKSDSTGMPMYLDLVQEKVLEEETVYRALADFAGMEYRFCQLHQINLPFVKRFPQELLSEYGGIPLEECDGCLTVLVSDPLRTEEFGELLSYGYSELRFVLGPLSQMKRILNYTNNRLQQDMVLTDCNDGEEARDEVMREEAPLDAPIIKLCDSIVKDAIHRGASDIHIEPFLQGVVVRFRVDGRLNRIEELSTHLYPALLARYKIMANLNIAEHRLPQDGKISMEVSGVPYDFRVSTMPAVHGEKLVIRIYNRNFRSGDLASLGFSQPQRELVMSMLTRPHGIILLTGPTGSGKSTTLYTFLRYLNREDVNIMTVEDPVENLIDGINQVQVNPKANLTFATALRSFLRQDPDIIMLGEIRDEETAQIATRAAVTGHLVLSSIHTNDAGSVIARLINMGVPKYLVADALLGAISQRLVRKLCPKCKRPKITDAAELKLLGLSAPCRIFEPVGCSYCGNTGYLGRVGVFEMMLMNDEIHELILSDRFSGNQITAVIARNTGTVLDRIRERVLAGETGLEEYARMMEPDGSISH